MHKKSAHFERFMINDDKSFYHWCANLLADAELGEDGLEDVGGGDFAGDLAEVVEDAADVLAEEVRRGVRAHGSAGIGEGFVGALESRVVAHVRDNDAASA